MLHLHNLRVTIDDYEIINIDDLSLQPGARLGLVGESGSGKTMTAKAIAGLLPNEAKVSGEVNFDGQNLLTLGDRDLAKVRGNFGATAGWASGNSNLDNTVDAADLAMVRENFGFDNPLVSGAPLAVPTPEPAGVLLIALGTVAFRRRRT